MNFLQRTPFFRLILALILGIVIFQYLSVPLGVLLGLSIVLVVTVIISLLTYSIDFQYKFRWFFGTGIFILFSVIGYSTCLFFDRNHEFPEMNHKSVYEVELISSPHEKPRSYLCKIKLLQQSDSAKTKKCIGNAIIYIQKDSLASKLALGDRLMIETEFKTPDGVQNPAGFDYATYLKRQGIGATAYISADNWKKTGTNTAFSIFRLSDKFRNYLLNIYRKFNIAGDEYAVLSALTLGYTDALLPDLLQSYSATGATHILSVSGLHVGIVYVVIFFLLGFLNKTQKQKIIRAIITTLFIWMYAFITGLSPAVIRATLMLSFVSAATCMERKSQIYNTILMSAFAMLLYNPNLLFNISFQLSYAAVISIVFFQPKISKLLYVKNKFLKSVWDLTAVSIAAQIGTAPLAIYYFHQFPNYFLLTNYIAIPISTFIIYFAIALLAFSAIPYFSTLIAFLLKWLLWIMNHLITAIQHIPGSITTVSFSGFQLVFVFLTLIFFVAFYYNKKFSLLVTSFVALLAVTSTYLYQTYHNVTTSKMIVFADSRVPIINFIDGTKNYVYTTDQIQAENTARSYWKSSMLQSPVYISSTNWLSDDFAVFKQKKILILKENFLKNKTSAKPIETDYLIICNKIKPRIEEILACVHPKNIVVDKSISQWYTNHIKETCQKQNILFYSIAEKGAFVVEFER